VGDVFDGDPARGDVLLQEILASHVGTHFQVEVRVAYLKPSRASARPLAVRLPSSHVPRRWSNGPAEGVVHEPRLLERRQLVAHQEQSMRSCARLSYRRVNFRPPQPNLREYNFYDVGLIVSG